MRKRIVLSIATLFIAISSFAVDRVITYDQLPQNAKIFIEKYFSTSKTAYVSYDPEIFDSSYSVTFVSGDAIEFDSKGQWKEVKCVAIAMPQDLIPTNVQPYLNANLPEVAVKKIEKNKRGVELTLANGMELKFNNEGAIIEIDD